MIAYLKGKLAVSGIGWVIIDVNGIGYQVYIPSTTRLPQIDQEIKLFTYMAIREDAIQFYGFSQEDEKNCFLALLDVAGVGPKVALAVVSCLPPGNLQTVISNGDISPLIKVPGVGKKTAQRILLELKDKLKGTVILKEEISPTDFTAGVEDDASAALQALGYSQLEARDAVRRVRSKNSINDLSELIRIALKELAPVR